MISYSDITGGAARAAYRIHHALRLQGVDSTMRVNSANTDDWTVRGQVGNLQNLLTISRLVPGKLATRLLRTNNRVIHSPAILHSSWPKRLNISDADIINLHWVNHEMMSIGDIARIKKPVVWTLHDMWPFCGAEHYTEDFRWREGYTRNNRPSYEAGLDLNRWVWRRKMRNWRRPMHIVSPSNWLAGCARQSMLMREWPVTVVPNAVDTSVWQPLNKSLARELLKLPNDAPLLLFGAVGGARDPRKGFELLRQALRHLQGQVKELQLIVFGQHAPREPDDLGFPIHYMGHLHDDLSLRVLYSAADAMVIPSRQDNLPNTGVEALACGTPVVAFNTCGLPDIVKHEKTGYLAEPFNSEDLASGIIWVLADAARHAQLCVNARHYATATFSYPVVAEQYLSVYQSAVDLQL